MALRPYVTIAALIGLLAFYLPSLLGRTEIDYTRLLRWANSGPLNNQDCVVNRVADACEDSVIHYPSSTAFLACGNPSERSAWYPAAGAHNASGRTSFRESLFKYDIKTGRTTELRIEGLEGDFVTHGIDLLESPTSKSKV